MFRDIKRVAFHRSHPLVPTMNASPTTTPTLHRTAKLPPPPLNPDRAHSHGLPGSRPSDVPPNRYTPNLQLTYCLLQRCYYTPGSDRWFTYPLPLTPSIHPRGMDKRNSKSALRCKVNRALCVTVLSMVLYFRFGNYFKGCKTPPEKFLRVKLFFEGERHFCFYI